METKQSNINVEPLRPLRVTPVLVKKVFEKGAMPNLRKKTTLSSTLHGERFYYTTDSAGDSTDIIIYTPKMKRVVFNERLLTSNIANTLDSTLPPLVPVIQQAYAAIPPPILRYASVLKTLIPNSVNQSPDHINWVFSQMNEQAFVRIIKNKSVLLTETNVLTLSN